MEHQAQYSDLLQLSKELDHIYHEVSLKMGLSDSGFSLLYALCERGAPTAPSELYADWSLSKQTGHSALLALEKRGLVALSPDPRDGRGKLVALTPAGAVYVKQTIRPLMAAERSSFARLTGEEQNQLVALTEKSVILLKEELSGLLSGPAGTHL